MADLHTPKKYILKTVKVLRDEGVRSFGVKGLTKLAKKLDKPKENSQRSVKIRFTSIVDRRDVMRADWSVLSKTKKHSKNTSKKVTNWVISPPSGGGGHQNMFRFIEHLDKNGFTNNIYLYSTNDDMTLEQAAKNVSAYATLSRTTFFYYDRDKKMADAAILFATGWETAYPVFNEKTTAKKFYFVQDFEPLFYPMGTEYLLAENTYRFGFHGITAGKWLAKKLSGDYGMTCDSYDFGANKDLYAFDNKKKRKEVFFYARPVTERRAFDLGIMTLELFHQKHPDYIINLAGWDVSDYDVSFPYINHKSLKLEDLSELYNKCAVGLVLSLTNMSLMPLELLACGTIPVMNDGENNRLVSNSPYIAYTDSSPAELASKMSEVVKRKDLPTYAEKAARSIKSNSWDKAKKAFLETIEKELHG